MFWACGVYRFVYKAMQGLHGEGFGGVGALEFTHRVLGCSTFDKTWAIAMLQAMRFEHFLGESCSWLSC